MTGGLALAGARNLSAYAPRKIQVGISKFPSLSPFYIAIERGYFKEYGLEIETQQLSSAAQHIPLLIKGELEASLTGASPALFNAVGQGARIRIVCGREIVGPECHDIGVLYARKDRFGKTAADPRSWKGKKIGFVQRSGVSEFFLDTILESAGLPLDHVERMYVGRAESLLAIENGSVDAVMASTGDAYRQRLTEKGYFREPVAARINPDFQYSYVLFGGKILEEPETGARFVAAYLRGVKDSLAGCVPQFLREFAASNNIDIKSFDQHCEFASTPDGAIHLNDVAKLILWGQRRGYIESGVQASQVADTRFWKQAQLVLAGKSK